MDTVDGDPLYVRTSEALLVPVILGTKLTLMVHDAPTATLDPHVEETRKDVGCDPVRVRLRTVSTAFPVFLTTIDDGAEVEFTARL